MKKIFGDSNGDVPRIALAVGDRDPYERLRGMPIDLLEVRVDLFANQKIQAIEETILKLKDLGVPIILTVRNDKAEGGLEGINDDKKFLIFHSFISLVDIVDIESRSPIIDRVVNLARENEKNVIVSRHDLEKTPEPEELEAIFAAARLQGADIVKIAALARSMSDVVTMLDFTIRHRKDNIITISMGPNGAISRLAFPAAGSMLTYTFHDKPAAMGQIPLGALVDDMRRYYPNFRK